MWSPENKAWINLKRKKKVGVCLIAVEKSSREVWTSPLIFHRNISNVLFSLINFLF